MMDEQTIFAAFYMSVHAMHNRLQHCNLSKVMKHERNVCMSSDSKYLSKQVMIDFLQLDP